MSGIEVVRLTVMRERLRDAYREFAAPRRITIQRESGELTHHVGPSLWAQLCSAVANGTERQGPGGSRPVERSLLIAAAALDLKRSIERQTRFWGAERAFEPRVHRAIQEACRLFDTQRLQDITERVIHWNRAIVGMLSPPRRMHIAASCPVCEVSMVTRYDITAGEEVRMHALQIVIGDTGQPECTCIHCGAWWPSGHLEDLADRLNLPGVSHDE